MVHCIMCAVFSVARPHSHVASHSKYRHLCLRSLLHVNPVRNPFRQLLVANGLSYPLASYSHRVTATLCGVVFNILNHSLHRIILVENSAGVTLRKKQFLDFSHGIVHNREWASLVSCLAFSIQVHTSLPASKYRSSTLVGVRHLVTALYTLFGSVFSFWT